MVIQGFLNILNVVGTVAFILCITILPILAMWRRTRGVAGIIYFCSSYVFGLTAWIMGFIITLSLWGWFGVIVGLIFAGVGVVPFGIIASLIHREWMLALNLFLTVLLTFGIRFLGVWLISKAESKSTSVIDGQIIE